MMAGCFGENESFGANTLMTDDTIDDIADMDDDLGSGIKWPVVNEVRQQFYRWLSVVSANLCYVAYSGDRACECSGYRA